MEIYNNVPKGYTIKNCYNCKYHVRYHNERNRMKRHKCNYIHEYFDPLTINDCEYYKLGDTTNYRRKSHPKKYRKLSKKKKLKMKQEQAKAKAFEKKIDQILKKMSSD